MKPTGVTKDRIGHGCYITTKEMGTITIETKSGSKESFDVLYIQGLDQNFLRTAQLLEKCFELYNEDKDCLIMKA